MAVRDIDALSLGSLSAAGAVSLSAGGAITSTGAVQVGGDMTLDTRTHEIQRISTGTHTAGTYTLTVQVPVAGGSPTSHTTGALALNATDAQIRAALVAALATVDAAQVSVSNKDVTFGGSLSGLDLPLMTLNSSLSGGSGQAITQIQAGASSDIILDNAGNAIEGDLTVAGGRDVRIRSIGGLHMIGARIGNNLYIEATAPISGDTQGVRNSDGWEVQGWTQIEAAGQDVVLTADHQFVGAVSINARNVIINDIDDIVLGTLNLTGSLTITGGRDITVANGGSLVVTGTTDDGVVEAFEVEGRPEVFALQWHPEMLSDQTDPAFLWLVREAAVFGTR